MTLRLNHVEGVCQDVLMAVSEMMSPGRRHISPKEHMELHGRVRNALRNLEFKRYGCVLGLHCGPCRCEEDPANGYKKASTKYREAAHKHAPEDQSRQ